MSSFVSRRITSIVAAVALSLAGVMGASSAAHAKSITDFDIEVECNGDMCMNFGVTTYSDGSMSWESLGASYPKSDLGFLQWLLL